MHGGFISEIAEGVGNTDRKKKDNEVFQVVSIDYTQAELHEVWLLTRCLSSCAYISAKSITK